MKEKSYIQDLTEIRSMMERSAKFLSLSGWAGILSGIYALLGSYVAYEVFNFNPRTITEAYPGEELNLSNKISIVSVAVAVLIISLITAVYMSYRQSQKRGEKLWTPTSKRLLNVMAVPMITGGVAMIAALYNGVPALMAPLSLIFYGLALYNASKLTIFEVKVLGYTQIILGIAALFFIHLGLLFWAIGFGAAHIVYGVFMYYKYEK